MLDISLVRFLTLETLTVAMHVSETTLFFITGTDNLIHVNTGTDIDASSGG